MKQPDKLNINYMMVWYNGYHRRKAEVNEVISDNDAMFWNDVRDPKDEAMVKNCIRHYFGMGESAIDTIILGCLSSGLSQVGTVLDLACGHGRVLRHLVKLFPSARFSAADINEDGVNFCVQQFGVKGIHAPVDIDELDFEDHYDVVWAGSLFTHFPLEKVKRTIAHVCSYLTHGGVFIFTLHGRASRKKIRFGGGEAASVRKAMEDYEETGYGFFRWSPEELIAPRHRPDIQRAFSRALATPDYGMSISRPSAVMHEVERMQNVEILAYREGAWMGLQDVMVVGKPVS